MAQRDKYHYVISPKIGRVIREFYHGICQYCDAENADHVDHIVPQASGGDDSLKNYILACARCNQKKGAGDIAPQYLALITSIADRNKDWILAKILRPVKGFNVLRIGIDDSIYRDIAISNPPTEFDVRVIQFWNDFFIRLRKLVHGAKSENGTIQG